MFCQCLQIDTSLMIETLIGGCHMSVSQWITIIGCIQTELRLINTSKNVLTFLETVYSVALFIKKQSN